MQLSQNYLLSAQPAFAEHIAQIEQLLHRDRELAQQMIEALMAESRLQHDAVGFISAVEMQSQVTYGITILDLQYEALQMAQNQHLFAAEARLLNLIGRAYYAAAQYQEAMQTWGCCLEVAELSAEYGAWIKAKMGVGQIYDALGDPSSAIKMHQEAIDRSLTLGDDWLRLQAHINLGVNLHRLRRSNEALASFNFALDTARQLNHEDDVAECLMRIGEVQLALHVFSRAAVSLESAQVIAERSGYKWALTQILRLRAECFLSMNQPKEALKQIYYGIQVADEAGAMHPKMLLLNLQSQICERVGDLAVALLAQREAQRIEQQIHQAARRDPLQQVAQLSGLLHNPDQILLDLASNLSIGKNDLAHLSATLCATACRALNVKQASFWQWQTQERLCCLMRCNAQAQALVLGPDLERESLSALLTQLEAGEIIIAHTAAQHLYTWQWSEYALQAQGITAVLLIPVRLNNETIAVLVCEHLDGQRNWRRDEVQHAQQLGLLATRALAQYRQQSYVEQIAALNTRLLHQNDELEVRVNERTQALEQARGKLVQAEKLAALGHLVAGFAHELNTPLGSILTASTTLSAQSRVINQQLQTGALKKSQVDQYVVQGQEISELIERNARRASDLIYDLKQLTIDSSSHETQTVCLHDLVENVVQHFTVPQQHRLITIENRIDPQLILNSYRSEIEMIVNQLIQNSLLHAFAPNSAGKIEIASMLAAGKTIVLVYRDNGVGIDAAAQKKVFDPFYTTQFGQGRSGLGLYQVYSVVHGRLGGEIALSSEPTQGTQITITLPLGVD
jgi:two-component system NtrC family sensor kinase